MWMKFNIFESKLPWPHQESQQDMHPNHLHETGLGNNTPSRNTKTPNETETKSRIKTDENTPVPSSTSQQGRKYPVKTSERHENTRSQHHGDWSWPLSMLELTPPLTTCPTWSVSLCLHLDT